MATALSTAWRPAGFCDTMALVLQLSACAFSAYCPAFCSGSASVLWSGPLAAAWRHSSRLPLQPLLASTLHMQRGEVDLDLPLQR